MNASRKVSLGVCDYCIFSLHRVWERRSGGGNFCYVMLEFKEHLNPGDVRAALARTLRAHPVVMGQVRVSPLRFRPFWETPANPDNAAVQAAAEAHVFDDLRNCVDAAARLEDLCQSRYSGQWYRPSGPQVRLEQYALPDERTRIVIRWPHYLMDADGALWFLAALGDEASTGETESADYAACLMADDERPRVLTGHSCVELFEILRKASAAQRKPKGLRSRHLLASDAPRLSDYRFLHRHWSREQFATFRETAKRLTPPGPALYARYLAAAVCRAQQRLYVERGLATDAFFITFPMRVGVSVPGRYLLARRPLVGNYLVTPTICVLAREAADRPVLSELIQQQVQGFLSAGGDLAQWALLEAAALVHPWFYHWLFKLPLSVNRCSSGFSYYGVDKGHLKSFGGAKVLNIWGGGPTTTPPAWNPVFYRFDDLLNFSLTYSRPAISDELATRYADLIEDELMNPS